MCCDGTLYVRARIAPGEELRIIEHGLERMESEGKSYFALPCAYESCGRCTIYETRFEVCGTFRCALLRRQEAGEISLDDARDTVTQALELRRQVTEADSGAGAYRVRRELRESLAEELAKGATTDRAATAERLLNIIALDTFLERWFRNKKGNDQIAEELRMADSNS
jgi:hypothetical protein